LNLHSATWETVQDDVVESFKFRNLGRLHAVYTVFVLLKPSVTIVMTALSLAFTLFWVAVLVITLRGL
jgi:hypothetical protein